MNGSDKRAPELLPCPFCGESTAFDESHRTDCYFRVSQQLLDDADVSGSLSEVYDAWNRRAALAPPDGYVLVPAELVAAIEDLTLIYEAGGDIDCKLSQVEELLAARPEMKL